MAHARQIWLSIHRWLGLAAAALFVVVGLSGSFLVFYLDIDRALNPDLVRATPTADPLPMSAILDAVTPVLEGRFLHSVFPPRDAHDVHHVWLTPSASDQSRMWEVLVDPYSGEVRGERAAVPVVEFSRRNITNTIYTLHFQLFAGSTGSTVVGVIGVLLMISATTGLVLWWPRPGGWRRALSIKRHASGFRLHFDIHRTVGAYGSIVLVVVAFTGVSLTFPDIVRSLLPLGTETAELPSGIDSRRAASPINADTVLALAQMAVPRGSVTCLWLPGASGAAWRVTLREQGGVLLAGGRADAYVGAGDGRLVRVARHDEASAEDTFFAWQLPLHNGTAFGFIGRIVVFVSGFVPLVLAVTGLLIYLRKRKARSHRTGRPARVTTE